jgi:hypothetical protein
LSLNFNFESKQKGNTNWWGKYDECIEAKTVDFNSKYCSIPLHNNGSALSVKYGICMPENCNNNDITIVMNTSIYLFIKKKFIRDKNFIN